MEILENKGSEGDKLVRNSTNGILEYFTQKVTGLSEGWRIRIERIMNGGPYDVNGESIPYDSLNEICNGLAKEISLKIGELKKLFPGDYSAIENDFLELKKSYIGSRERKFKTFKNEVEVMLITGKILRAYFGKHIHLFTMSDSLESEESLFQEGILLEREKRSRYFMDTLERVSSTYTPYI